MAKSAGEASHKNYFFTASRRDVFCYFICRGSSGSRDCRRCTAPRYSAWECPAIHPDFRCRAACLSLLAQKLFGSVSTLRDRVLSHVESRPPDCGSPQNRRSGFGPQAHPRTLRNLLERSPRVVRSRLAGTILLLPLRSLTSLGSAALRGKEPSARRVGRSSRDLRLVQCCGALRHGFTRCHSRHELLATALEPRGMARVSRGPRRGSRRRYHPKMHPHGQAARNTGIYQGPRKADAAQSCQSGFHCNLDTASTTKLSQPATLFDPRVGKLGNLGALSVDPLCFFGRHLSLECRCRSRLFDTRDGPPPRRACVRWSALAAQGAFRTNRFSRVIYLRIHDVTAIQPSVTRESLSCACGKASTSCMICKSIVH